MKISLPNKVSLFIFLSFLLFLFSFSFLVIRVNAQVPGLREPPCPEPADPEFHSLRPYQTSLCGQIAAKARFCSNELVFVETFELSEKCPTECHNCTFTCNPNFQVKPHTLYVELDNSFLPILGNTELVKNSQQAAESLDDATKVNEYVSWYLSGVTDTPEYGENTDEKLVNYSGPVNKLLPSLIQDAERVGSIKEALATGVKYTDEGDDPKGGGEEILGERHPEIVVCASRSGLLGILGKMVAHECYEGNGGKAKGTVYRLTDWENHMPPLPWDPEYENDPEAYQKARCDWEGGTPITIPILNKIACIDNPLKRNDWADLFHYVPLSPVADKKGANYIMGDGPSFDPYAGTNIENAQFTGFKNAPLYFAHTQEDKELSELLNSTYVPQGIKGEFLPETTELNESTNPNECRLVNIRANPGDDLFPGEPNEMQVENVEYLITEVECTEEHIKKQVRYPDGSIETVIEEIKKCPAGVEIQLKTGTKSPWAKEIWKTTTADSTSTFRKIFPKVEEGAPVSCIASMPTETTVEYDPSKSEKPNGGDQEFFIKAPGGGKVDPSDAKLHFPFIGSVYEYFLKGIQTALRPQGYGEPITNGEYCETSPQCGELPKLPGASGSCKLGGLRSSIDIPQSLKDIIEAAAETYKVPANLILAVMYGEGLFDGNNKKDWTDENVKNWATCEPVPGCSTSGDDNFMGFFSTIWAKVIPNIEGDLKKLDPNRETPSQCNLLDAIYGIAWNLHDSADGGAGVSDFPETCFGIPLGGSVPSSCTWTDNQIAAAIKITENGYDPGCLTLRNSCITGGGNAALCPDNDNCETINNPSLDAPSHFACLWEVAHGR